MQISLTDVAAKAGVSAATVSRVLNGKELNRIPEATRARVKRVALELNYQPNRFARALQSRRTMNIGVLVNGLRNPLFAELLDTLEEMIVDAGYDVLPDTGRRVNDVRATGARGWPVDGVLMWAVDHQRVDPALLSSGSDIPVVYLGHVRTDGADFVAYDAVQGTRLALEHLWERGFRKIAFAAPPGAEGQGPEARLITYESFCREKGLPPTRLPIERECEADEPRQSSYRRSGFEAGLRFALTAPEERPDAVFCYNDLIALGMMSAAISREIRIPQELAIVGFDGVYEGRYQARSLTTIEIPARALCSTALDMLLRRISRDLPDEPRQVILPMTLRAGETG